MADMKHPTFSQEIVPISGINPLFTNVSPPRQVMVGGNLTQSNVIRGATRKRLRSGLEREHAKGTFKHMFDQESIVIAVIPRYTGSVLSNPEARNPMDLVIYEEYETGRLNCIELHRFHVSHQHYGFHYKFNEDVLDKLNPLTRIPAGTVIADSPNVTEDGDYMIGLETNVCFITDPAVTEDGVVISESYAKRISASGFETRVFNCGRSHYPINLNGNTECYKAIPDIGEIIRSNGMIAAFRPFDPFLDPIYMTSSKLMEVSYGMDVPLYGKAGGRVVDIKVFHNEKHEDRGLPPEFTDQLRRYHEAEKEFYMKVIKACIVRKGRLDDNVLLGPDLWRVCYDAIAYVGSDLVKAGLWPKEDQDTLQRQRVYRGEPLDEWRVEITFEYTTEVAEGPKITNLHGSKGVAVSVLPDDCMPVDDNGNRSEVLMFGGSTVGRMTLGQQHEQVIGASGRDTIRTVRKNLGLDTHGKLDFKDIVNHLRKNESLAMEQFMFILGFYEIVSLNADYPEVKKYLDQGDRWLIHLAHVIEDGNDPWGMFIHIPAYTEVKTSKIIKDLKDSPYAPIITPVTYKWAGDKEYTRTNASILIGPTYFLALEKTASDWSAVSSSKVGHFGTTTRLTQADKYTRPGRETSTRTTGEDEIRNLCTSVGGEHVANINEMNNNPVAHKIVCRNVLTADKPTDIENVIDRKLYPVGGHRPLSFVHHISNCSGKEFRRD